MSEDIVKAEEETVRVLRVLEYVGPRKWVESTLEANYVKGTKHFQNGGRIRDGIIGNWPESLGADPSGEVTRLLTRLAMKESISPEEWLTYKDEAKKILGERKDRDHLEEVSRRWDEVEEMIES